MNSITHRLSQLQQHIEPQQAWLLSTPTDITYLSAFTFLVPEEREAFLVLTHQAVYLIHTTFSEFDVPAPIMPLAGCYPPRLIQHLQNLKDSHQITELLVDKSSLFVDEYEHIQTISNLRISSLPQKYLFAARMVKDEAEIAAIRQASSIALASYEAVIPQLKVGMTEQDVKKILEQEMINRGSQRPAFPTIVCFGAHGALPHHQPNTTPLTQDTVILFDFGATFNGYRSDMTRTIWYGNHPSELFTKIDKLIHKAYDATYTRMGQHYDCTMQGAPLLAKDIDTVARNIIAKAGYGDNFIHTTGHGVGLDIHEPPSLSWSSEWAILPGMVLTIEPGIYLEGKLGYRYENTVLVTETGVEELTKTT